MNVEQLAEIKHRLYDVEILGKMYVKGDPWKGYEIRDEQSGQVYAETSMGSVAELFAHAREDIPNLLAEVERLSAGRNITRLQIRQQFEEIARLRKALEFYATKQNIDLRLIHGNSYYSVDIDGGTVAREALSNGK